MVPAVLRRLAVIGNPSRASAVVLSTDNSALRTYELGSFATTKVRHRIITTRCLDPIGRASTRGATFTYSPKERPASAQAIPDAFCISVAPVDSKSNTVKSHFDRSAGRFQRKVFVGAESAVWLPAPDWPVLTKSPSAQNRIRIPFHRLPTPCHCTYCSNAPGWKYQGYTQ